MAGANQRYQLQSNSEMMKNIQVLITESEVAINAYVSAMENEGNDVLVKREELLKVKKPSKVEVNSLQTSLRNFKFAISDATGTMKVFEKKVHCELENFRKSKQQKNDEIDKLKCQERRLKQDIEELERKISTHRKEVNDKVARGLEYNDQAMSAAKKTKDVAAAGIIGSAAGSAAALLLAPFSGGLSLVVAGAAAGVSVGSAVTAASMSKGVQKMQKQANDELTDAASVSSKIKSLYTEMFQVINKIGEINVKIWDLERTTSALENVNDFLLLAIGKMNTTERHVQDLETAILDASQHGECFHELQRALAECPELEEIAKDCMKGLKDKWNLVMTNIWQTCR